MENYSHVFRSFKEGTSLPLRNQISKYTLFAWFSLVPRFPAYISLYICENCEYCYMSLNFSNFCGSHYFSNEYSAQICMNWNVLNLTIVLRFSISTLCKLIIFLMIRVDPNLSLRLSILTEFKITWCIFNLAIWIVEFLKFTKFRLFSPVTKP